MTDWGMYAFLAVFYVALLIPVGLLLWLVAKFLRRASFHDRHKAAIFATVSMIVACPVIVPAGTISLAVVPLGVALAFSRNVDDLLWFGKLWQMNLTGFLIAMIVSVLVAKRLFSNHRFQGDAEQAPRA